MASAGRKAGQQVSWRYVLVKMAEARNEMLARVEAGTAAPASGMVESAVLWARAFKEVYARPSTTAMLLAGTAMSPTLNAHALKDPSAVDKLVVRLLPRPGPATVAVGDVVAFSNPRARHDAAEQNLMVRRVAAMEGDTLEGEEGGGTSDAEEGGEFVLPPGHCWLLADNEALAPPDVIDSRTFGPLPYELIRGRVVYQAASLADHGMVQNNPTHSHEDVAVIETEVDVEELLSGLPQGEEEQ